MAWREAEGKGNGGEALDDHQGGRGKGRLWVIVVLIPPLNVH